MALEVVVGATIGAQGGTLSAANGALNLAIPGGSVAQPTLVIVRPAAPTPADARVLAPTAFEVGPEGMNFTGIVRMTLTYDAAALPAGIDAVSLQLYRLADGQWQRVPGSAVNPATRQVTGTIFRSGVYAVRSTPVDRIALLGASADVAMYAGQVTTLRAVLLGATSDTLPARQITWTSSAPSVVSVDGVGKLTAAGPGTATITAAVDGKSVTTNVTILGRPNADWTRAGEWTTYMGNAQHTGYIDATIDPAVFAERWTQVPLPGAQLFQATVGNGRVYLATSTYFQSQKLMALNATTGAQRLAA